MKKVLILGNSQLVVYKFRKELIETLVKSNYEVSVSFPNGPFGEGEEISKKMGCKFIETPINRRGKNPLDDMKLFFHYIKILRELKPDVVLGYTVKPDIYGGFACRLLKVPFVANITGLGTGLIKNNITKKVLIKLYRHALKKAKCVFFQNKGDMNFFEENMIAIGKGILIPGSGVNIKEFTPLEYPNDDEIHFSYIARVMKAKGIEQYLEAANKLKIKYPNTIFHVLGYCEDDYTVTLKKAEENNIIKYHGLVNDILEHQKYCHCVVLPSFHPEGISNVLLEGAACARPLITTDRIGCKEAVTDGKSGYLIKERDSEDLTEKLEKFILLPNSEKKNMGLYGRGKIEKEFDRQIVVDKYINIIKKI